MEINVRKIAELAMLDIPDNDIPRLEHDMEEIVAMVSELPDIEDESIVPEPMELRSDTATDDGIDREELMQNAPGTVRECFAVPRTVEY